MLRRFLSVARALDEFHNWDYLKFLNCFFTSVERFVVGVSVCVY